MAKYVKVPVRVADKEHGRVVLSPGDKVPSWAADLVPDEAVAEGVDHPVAAGTDLLSDHTWNEMARAADRAGVDYKKTWSTDQIAAAIRRKLFDDEKTERYGEDYKSDAENQAASFDAVNAAGNVNAADGSTARRRSSTSESSGGADS